MTDDLLEQHFSRVENPLNDSDWLAVRRLARRPRRRVALVALAAAAAALLVAPAFGLGGRVLDLIRGDPAPTEVQTSFAAGNESRERLFEFAAAAGHELHDRFSPVIAGEARGVAAIETPDGPIYLWVAPTEDGRQCWLIQAGEDSATGRPYGGGSCDGIDRMSASTTRPSLGSSSSSKAGLESRFPSSAVTRWGRSRSRNRFTSSLLSVATPTARWSSAGRLLSEVADRFGQEGRASSTFSGWPSGLTLRIALTRFPSASITNVVRLMPMYLRPA